MEREDIRDWLLRYADAWEQRDPDVAAALFAEDAEYHVTPFTVHEGRAAIRSYWADATADQSAVSVEVEVLAVTNAYAIGRFRAEKVEDGDETVTDGVCLIELDAQGRCTVFREWWHADD